MQIYLSGMDRARQAAKSLKLSLDHWGFERPLTWHQDTIAKMLGYSDWNALGACVKTGHPPSAPDEEIEHGDLMMRRTYQTQVLIDRVGKTLDPEILSSIARHVAPSGGPESGAAYISVELETDEDGNPIPLSLDLLTEDALFSWTNLPLQKGYEHVTDTFDPKADELYAMIENGDPAAVQSVTQFIINKPDDDLDKLTLFAILSRGSGDHKLAEKLIAKAYKIGSLAWAPVARERRRRHNPVRWWDEPNTRPFIRMLREKGIIDIRSGTLSGIQSGFYLFRVIVALNPADPLEVELFSKYYRERLEKIDK